MSNVDNVLQSLARLTGSKFSKLTSCNCWPIFVFSLTKSSSHLDWGWLVTGLENMFIQRKMLSTTPFWLLTAKPLFQGRCRQFVTFWFFACSSVHHLLVCNFGCDDFRGPLLSTSPSVWRSLDHTTYAAPFRWYSARIPLNGDGHQIPLHTIEYNANSPLLGKEESYVL